ncbi:MAG: phage tail sheath family protein [Betaproteobacteria bacterium]|jgi:phage tail sheath protein FI|nr:phage tail sheath subtilisin-like domain-containing protein [Rubrivivax sp.]
MPEYLAPGVFVEETSFRAKSIEGVSTTTTGFIGAARFGPVAMEPDILTSLADYERLYELGTPGAELDFDDAGAAPNHLWHAVRAFFTEGGKRLYVSRIFRRTDDEDPAPLDDTADLAVSAPANSYPDGHARVDPSRTGDLRIRARHPGAAANLRVQFTLRGSPNVLASEVDVESGQTVNTLRAVNDRDLVWVHRVSSPPSSGDPGQLCMARRLEDERSWEFETAGSGSPALAETFGIGDLHFDATPGEGDSVRVVTLSIALQSRDGAREIASWAGLPLDPQHRSGSSRDSVFARFGNNPASVADARGLPLVLVADESVSSALDVVATLFGSAGDPLDALVPSSDDVRRGISAGDKLAAGAIHAEFQLSGGHDGRRPTFSEYEGDADPRKGYALGLRQFEDIEDISMVAAPGSTWRYADVRSDANQVIGLLIAHAERMRYRIALIDSGDGLPISEVRGMRAKIDSKHAALYYPWVTVLDPVTRREINLPPSGFVAGICARNDVERGVYKAPANEVVRLALGFETLLNKGQQEVLNPEGINCFRYFEGRGFRLWGARTISSDPEWKYLNVRRYFAYLERSIDKGTQWAVFEPNGDALWANVRRTIEDFLLNEWQSGALLGDKPEKAFFVRCDRTTMTQNDIDNGRLICLIGVAPLKPAEFVIFRIGQWTADRKV